jgi:CheY-like chemotaxis protein
MQKIIKGKILTVDDDIMTRMIVTRFIDMIGGEPVEVSNGIEAVNAFKMNTFQVILMDIVMPELDGISAARQIRQYEADHNIIPIPIIAITGDQYFPEKANLTEIGFNDCIIKPLSFKVFSEKIKALIG